MQNNGDQIMQMDSAKILEILKDPNAPLFDKAKACQREALVGDKDAVPVLTAMLGDPKLAHYARYGLEPIPDPSVDAALRGALPKLKARQLAGAINSIGVRRDRKAVDMLAKYLGDKDPEVAQSAATALGKIGDANAAKRLQKAIGSAKPQVRGAIADACLSCAERLQANGNAKGADELHRAIQKADLPDFVKSAARR